MNDMNGLVMFYNRDIMSKFFGGNFKGVDVMMMSISDFDILLLEFGFKSVSEFYTNGWEIDFWNYYVNDAGKRLCLTGSLYSGNFSIDFDVDLEEDETNYESTEEMGDDNLAILGEDLSILIASTRAYLDELKKSRGLDENSL